MIKKGVGGEFGNLMTPRLLVVGSGFSGKQSLTFRAFFEGIFDDFVDSCRWQLPTKMSAMALLTALFLPGGLLRRQFGNIGRIGRR